MTDHFSKQINLQPPAATAITQVNTTSPSESTASKQTNHFATQDSRDTTNTNDLMNSKKNRFSPTQNQMNLKDKPEYNLNNLPEVDSKGRKRTPMLENQNESCCSGCTIF